MTQLHQNACVLSENNCIPSVQKLGYIAWLFSQALNEKKIQIKIDIVIVHFIHFFSFLLLDITTNMNAQ